MRGMVLDPRGRLKRRWFVYDLILPNIGAGVLIVMIKVMNLGIVGDVALGGIAAVLIWSANFAAPIARFHDLGVPAGVHLALVGVIFALTTIGPIGGPGDLATRFSDWTEVARGGASALPPVEGLSQRIGGLMAIGQLLVLVFAPGQKGSNKFGPDPRESV